MSAADGERRVDIENALVRYEGPLLSYARHLTGDADRARDLVQETFCRLVEKPPEAAIGQNVNGQLTTWLYTVCRNLAMDHRRKESRMTTVGHINDDALSVRHDPPPAPLAAAEQREDADRLLIALAALPSGQQEIVRLKFQNDMSYREIAAITGKSVTNVGVTLHNAIKTLRERMA